MTRMLVCATISLLFAADMTQAQNPIRDSHTNSPDAEIDRLLDQKRDMVFNDETLEDLAEFIRNQGIPTFVDERALDDVGIGTDTEFTFRQHAVRLRDGLKLALRYYDLSFTVRNGRLVITTQEEEEYRLITKVYDVRNLVELSPYPVSGGFGGPVTYAYTYDFDSLIETITSTIEPESWDEVGGPGTIQPFYTRRMRVIVVSQTYDVQRQLQSLLNELARHGGSKPLSSAPAFSPPNQPSSPLATTPSSQPSRPSTGIRSSQLRTTGQ